MPAFPIDPRRFHWSRPDGSSHGMFTPNGPLVYDRKRANPENWGGDEPVWAARILVGLSIGKKKAWSENDVVEIVKRVRKAQVGKPDSSFVRQRGLYTQTFTNKKGRATKEVVDEQGIQIFILNLPAFKTSEKKFRKQIVELGEALCRELKQEEVIVELQEGGMTRYTMGVGP